jgi:MFS transporter, PAT family, beta-lactamase induction signal transducer AmpG
MPAKNLDHPAAARPSALLERPWLFGLLIAPMAVLSNGIIGGGGLSYLFRSQGVDMARGAEIIALLNLPQIIYFLWSPLTDFWIRRRSWLIMASTTAAICMFFAFQRPLLASNSAVALIFLSACIGQLVIAACGGMMGTLHSETNRRRAGSFYQGGSLGFGAVALFVLTFLSERMHLGTLGWVAAAMIALPSLAALAAPEQDVVSDRTLKQTIARIGQEGKATFLRWEAIPYTLTCMFPMGSGAMIQLLPGLARDYHVGGHQVGWINGVAGSLLMAAGAMTYPLIPMRVRAPVAYLTVGLINEAALAIVWLGPLRPSTYLVGSTLFLFTVGASYAGFTSVVLEFLGKSGKSGSARYSIINALGNIPVASMVLIDGLGYARWGIRGMPGIDVVVGSVASLSMLAYFLTHPRRPTLDSQAGDISGVATSAT